MRAWAREIPMWAGAAGVVGAFGAGPAVAKPYGPMAEDLLLRIGPPMPLLVVKLLWILGVAVAGAGCLGALWSVQKGQGVPWGVLGATLPLGAALIAVGWALEGDWLLDLLRPPEWRIGNA